LKQQHGARQYLHTVRYYIIYYIHNVRSIYQDIEPKHFNALEQFTAHYYSFAKSAAAVPGNIVSPAAAAIAEWKRMISKTGEYQRDNVLWQTVPSEDAGDGAAEYEWWAMRFCNNSPGRQALHGVVKHLYALRCSEAASEREFSTAGFIEAHRESMRASTHKSLTHIRWQAQRDRCQTRKRRREDDDDVAEDSEDGEDAAGAVVQEGHAEELLREAFDVDEHEMERRQTERNATNILLL